MDSLNGVQYVISLHWQNLIDGLNVKDDAFTGARVDQKTGEQKMFAQFEFAACFSQRTECNRPNCELDLSVDTTFNNF